MCQVGRGSSQWVSAFSHQGKLHLSKGCKIQSRSICLIVEVRIANRHQWACLIMVLSFLDQYLENVSTFCSWGITFCSLHCRRKSATYWEINQPIPTAPGRWLLHQTCQRTQPHLSSQTLHLLQWSLQKKSLLKAKRLTTASVRLTKCPG